MRARSARSCLNARDRRALVLVYGLKVRCKCLRGKFNFADGAGGSGWQNEAIHLNGVLQVIEILEAGVGIEPAYTDLQSVNATVKSKPY